MFLKIKLYKKQFFKKLDSKKPKAYHFNKLKKFKIIYILIIIYLKKLMDLKIYYILNKSIIFFKIVKLKKKHNLIIFKRKRVKMQNGSFLHFHYHENLDFFVNF